MGSHDSAEVCEIVGLFLLKEVLLLESKGNSLSAADKGEVGDVTGDVIGNNLSVADKGDVGKDVTEIKEKLLEELSGKM